MPYKDRRACLHHHNGRAAHPAAGGALPVRARAGGLNINKTMTERTRTCPPRIAHGSYFADRPATEPMSVEETKIFLRIEHDDDTNLVQP